MTTQLLEVDGLRAGYGLATVIRDATFEVRSGEIVVLLGSNGAGKTTTLRALSGMIQRSGVVRLGGTDLVRMRPDAVARAGVAHVPQGRGTFPELSVEDNLRIGGFRRRRRQLEQDIERWYEHFPRLAERRRQEGVTLSGGEQQMLAIARALARDIKLLLLDEPYEGLAPVIVQEIEKILSEIKALGITTIIVEQNAIAALKLADRAVILDTGEVAFTGSAREVLDSEELRREYLAL